jgi:hypothetical protein
MHQLHDKWCATFACQCTARQVNSKIVPIRSVLHGKLVKVENLGKFDSFVHPYVPDSIKATALTINKLY